MIVLELTRQEQQQTAGDDKMVKAFPSFPVSSSSSALRGSSRFIKLVVKDDDKDDKGAVVAAALTPEPNTINSYITKLTLDGDQVE